jgi:hypothetical protein
MSSSFFKKAATDIDSLEQEFLGPDYKYFANINNPDQLGMSGAGSMDTMEADVAGLINYVQVLVSGDGAASKTGKPLGDKFFLKTGGKCTTSDGDVVTRSLYVNNVPDGDLPFISSMSGFNFTVFEGLLPGIMEDIGKLSPLPLFGAFMQGAEPACTQITMPTIDVNNVQGTGSGYVTNSEIKGMNSAWFTAGSKPSVEGFINANNKMVEKYSPRSKRVRKGSIPNLYRVGFGIFLVYLFYRVMMKKKN